MNNPKISVIIPVFNAERYLKQCIESVTLQTLKELEIICVDDGSQDASRSMLAQMAEEDSRIRVHLHEKNRSAFEARKTGITAATGEYIMFLDSDDYLELNACEQLYNKITQENVDILHFSSQIVFDSKPDESKKKSLEQVIRPYTQKLTGKRVFQSGFVDQKFFGTLWNKIYRTEICKKAVAELPEDYLAIAEDLLTFCAISYYAQSYLGWDSSPMHNYRIGSGTTTSPKMTLPRFERQCAQSRVIDHMRAFCEKQGVYQTAKQRIDWCEANWREGCCNVWYHELSPKLAAEGWKLLCQYWGSRVILERMASVYFDDRREFAKKLENLPAISLKDRKIQTVAFYYHRMYAGGVERVISVLSPMFLKMGYKVVIITDEPPTDKDFALPEEVIRETVFHHLETDDSNVGRRLESLEEVVRNHNVDLLLYNSWISNLLLWDMLYMKSMGIPVVIHTHGVFSCTLAEVGELFVELTNVLHLADGVITLSKADKLFWDCYCGNVHCIPNPASEELIDAREASWDNKSLIWVGRVSGEKQPEKVFDIMERVAADVPDAKLYALGDFDDPKWQKLAEAKGVENNVIFCGMVKNVDHYLEKASVYVCTSQFEGFLMSLVEAQAHKMPTVMFQQSHLTLATPERGVVSVGMDDTASAAEEVVRFLQDREHWQENSRMAYESFLWLRNFDLEGAWRNVLTGVVPENTSNPQVRNMVNSFVNNYYRGLLNRESKNPVIWFLQKAVGGIVCCMESGLKNTVRLGIKKIKKRFGK